MLVGSGEVFSSGVDLKAIPNDLYRAIPFIGVPFDKPVIAAFHGWCFRGAMVLTFMCDLLNAAEGAMFSHPEVKIGFSGGLISNLASGIPHKLTMKILLTGEAISAEPAYEVGCLNKITPTQNVMTTA